MKPIAAAAMLVMLCGCVPPPARVDAPRTEALDKSYVVDLPRGWIRMATADKTWVASKDGFPLEAIAVSKRPLKEAFARTKKSATLDMLPSELAELQIAELKAIGPQLAALAVLENEPALLSDRDGYRMKVSYKTLRGLEIQRLVYGVADPSGYYVIEYFAPALYYFDKYRPDFEKVVASFRLTVGKASAPSRPAHRQAFGQMRIAAVPLRSLEITRQVC